MRRVHCHLDLSRQLLVVGSLFSLLHWPLSSSYELIEGRILEGVRMKLLTGQNLTLTCQLTGLEGSVDELYFTRDGIQITDNVTQLPSERTIVLNIESVVRDNPSYFYTCDHRDWHFPLGVIEILVGDPVEAVNSISCYSPRFEYMVCSWCPDHFDPDYETMWTLHWRTLTRGEEECRYYPDPLRRCRCQFDGSDFYKFAEYNMTVTASNLFSEFTSDVFTIRTDASMVVAGKVRDLVVSEILARSFLVQWQVPSTLAWFPTPVEYRVNCTLKENNITVLGQVVSDTRLNITAVPATEYLITVETRPVTSSYWGEVESVTMVTPEAAPDVGPEIVNFRQGECSGLRDNCRIVAIFWKELPVHSRNGEITGYTVKVSPELPWTGTSQGTGEAPELSAESVSYALELESRTTYTLSLSASTSAGLSPYSSIYLPAATLLPSAPWLPVLETINTTHTRLTWSPDEHTDSVAIFTCRGQLGENFLCLGDVSQDIVAVADGEYVMPSLDADHVLGVSSIRQGQSSGLTSNWMCTYRYNGAIAEPVFYLYGGSDYVVIYLEPPACSLVDGWATSLYYQMKYCEAAVCQSEYVRVVNMSTHVVQYTLANLMAGAEYNISMRAVGDLTESVWTTQVVTLHSENVFVMLGLLGIIPAFAVVLILYGGARICSSRSSGISISLDKMSQSEMISRWLETQSKISGKGSVVGETFKSIDVIGRSSFDSGHGESVSDSGTAGQCNASSLNATPPAAWSGQILAVQPGEYTDSSNYTDQSALYYHMTRSDSSVDSGSLASWEEVSELQSGESGSSRSSSISRTSATDSVYGSSDVPPVCQDNKAPIDDNDLAPSVYPDAEAPIDRNDLVPSVTSGNKRPIDKNDLAPSVHLDEAPIDNSDLVLSVFIGNKAPTDNNDLAGSVHLDTKAPIDKNHLLPSVNIGNKAPIDNNDLDSSVNLENEAPID